MLLISSHILRCKEINVPDDAVIRINMAWVPSVDALRIQLRETINSIGEPYVVWLDNPIGRIKPPHYKYSLEELAYVMHDFPQIKYFAISNVEEANDLFDANRAVPEHVTVVPKIETVRGVQNFKTVLRIMKGERIAMLDHDDLFADIIRNGGNPEHLYSIHVDLLDRACRGNNATLLRTQGVVFSDKY